MSSATLQNPNKPIYIFRHSLLPVCQNGSSDAKNYILIPTLSKGLNGIMYMSQAALTRSVQQRTIEAIILFVRDYFIREAEPSTDKLYALYSIEGANLESMLEVSLYSPENLGKNAIIEAADAAIKLEFPRLTQKCDLVLSSLLNSSTIAQPFDSSFVYMTQRFLKGLSFSMDEFLPYATIACYQSLAKIRNASRILTFRTWENPALTSSQAASMATSAKAGNDSDSSDDYPSASPFSSNMEATANPAKTDRENIISFSHTRPSILVSSQLTAASSMDEMGLFPRSIAEGLKLPMFKDSRNIALTSSQAASMATSIKNGNDRDSSDDYPLASPLSSNMEATPNSEKRDRENITSPTELCSELYVINESSVLDESDQIEISKITSSPQQTGSYSEISKSSPPSACRNERTTCSSREAAQDLPPLAIYLDTFCKQENAQREYLYLSDEILKAAYTNSGSTPSLYSHVLEEYLSYNPHIKSLTLDKCSSLADNDILVLKNYKIIKLKIQNCPNITNKIHDNIASLSSVVQVEIYLCDRVRSVTKKWIESRGFSLDRKNENYYCVLPRRFLF